MSAGVQGDGARDGDQRLAPKGNRTETEASQQAVRGLLGPTPPSEAGRLARAGQGRAAVGRTLGHGVSMSERKAAARSRRPAGECPEAHLLSSKRVRGPWEAMILLGALAAGCLSVAGGRATASAAQPAESARWSVVGDAASDKDLSGAACAPDGRCLLVSDEKRRAWFFRLDETAPNGPKLDVGQRIKLSPAAGEDEADAEAAAFADGRFYVIGSHGTGRRNRRFQPSRYSLYRVMADGTVEAGNRLSEVFAGLDGIGEHFCTASKASAETCDTLQDGGSNIEGLAARADSSGTHLYVGFRAPAPGGRAFVVRVAEDAAFGRAAPGATVSRLRLGKDELGRDLGIRDLAAVREGFLVLAGPSLPEGDDAVGGGTVFHWDGRDEAARPLGEVGLRKVGTKPEVLLVLGEDAKGYRVMIMHDGVEGGKPMEYTLAR